MRNDLTEIVMLADRSGSMKMIQEDAEGGINSFIEEHKKDGDVIFTLCQFDDQIDFVYDAVPIEDVGEFELIPRGMTSLNDAVGQAINKTGARLSSLKEEDRPGLVIFVITTDGLENASREFSRADIKEMIDHQTSVYNWQFIYLGANQDAFAEAASLGTQSAGNFAMHRTNDAYTAVTRSTKSMKGQLLSAAPIDASFTDKELAAMADEDGA